MKKFIYSVCFLFASGFCQAQLSPAITSWLQNTTLTGTYYVKGNPVAIGNNILVNCQSIEYSDDFVYVMTEGIPAYPTGPFMDGNPSQAESQNAIFRIPLNPVPNTGTPVSTTTYNIGVFINGVSLFDSRDGASWKNSTSSMAGGPYDGEGDGLWNRDAVLAEKPGFDCSKGHPADGNYHHHQNPSAFKYDRDVISMVCNPYDANGLYVMDSTEHSPLIGFAYDGFPVYGAYGYRNIDGTGGIARMKSGYSLRDITKRTTDPDGNEVTPGPDLSDDYPLGYFVEDYEFIFRPDEPDYLDKHNGRFCVTPEYPEGTYAYFCTVDKNWNSYYPYSVGPTFYGEWADRKVSSIDEPTTPYLASVILPENEFDQLRFTIYPNACDIILIQAGSLVTHDLDVSLHDPNGTLLGKSTIGKGSTIAFFNTQTLYEEIYTIKVSNNGKDVFSKDVLITKE